MQPPHEEATRASAQGDDAVPSVVAEDSEPMADQAQLVRPSAADESPILSHNTGVSTPKAEGLSVEDALVGLFQEIGTRSPEQLDEKVSQAAGSLRESEDMLTLQNAGRDLADRFRVADSALGRRRQHQQYR